MLKLHNNIKKKKWEIKSFESFRNRGIYPMPNKAWP